MVRWLDKTWLVSVDDAWAYSQCPQAFLNSVDVARGLTKKPPHVDLPLRRLMGEVLAEHRARLLGDVASRTRSFVHVASPFRDGVGPDRLLNELDASHLCTDTALRDQVDAISGAIFAEREDHPGAVKLMWTGGVDVVTKSPRFAPEVDQVESGWELWETKLGASQTGKTLFRLAAFTEYARRQGFETTHRARIVFANGPDSLRGIRTVVDEWVDTKKRLVSDLESHLTAGEVLSWPSEHIPSCGRKTCAWCSQALAHHDDIFHLPGVTRAQRGALRAAGFHTVTAFADASRQEASRRVPTIPESRLMALHTQASLLSLATADENSPPPFDIVNPSALDALPTASDADIFVDFEADPTFRLWSALDRYFPAPAADHPRWWLGLDYLLGIAHWDTTAASGDFQGLWADNFREEEDIFRSFVDIIVTMRESDPTAHVYHYAPYEMVALHRMARRYRFGANFLARWEREGVFIDLYRIVTRAMLAGIPNYSLKSVEKLFVPPGSRNTISGGAESVESIRDFWQRRAGGETAEADGIKKEILSYNRQDTLSTRDLARWLGHQRAVR